MTTSPDLLIQMAHDRRRRLGATDATRTRRTRDERRALRRERRRGEHLARADWSSDW